MLKFKDGSHEIRRERVEAVSNLCGDWTGDRRNKVTRCWFCDIIYVSSEIPRGQNDLFTGEEKAM